MSYSPCANLPYPYRKNFKYDETIAAAEMDKLCKVRNIMGGNPSKPCRKFDNGNCWGEKEMAKYVAALDLNGINPKAIEYWTFFKYTNVVMGRWIRPTEFKLFMKLTHRKASVFVDRFELLPVNSDEPIRSHKRKDPRITRLTSVNANKSYTLSDIGSESGCFYIWIKQTGMYKDIFHANVYAIEDPERGATACDSINHALSLIGKKLSQYKSMSKKDPVGGLKILPSKTGCKKTTLFHLNKEADIFIPAAHQLINVQNVQSLKEKSNNGSIPQVKSDEPQVKKGMSQEEKNIFSTPIKPKVWADSQTNGSNNNDQGSQTNGSNNNDNTALGSQTNRFQNFHTNGLQNVPRLQTNGLQNVPRLQTNGLQNVPRLQTNGLQNAPRSQER